MSDSHYEPITNDVVEMWHGDAHTAGQVLLKLRRVLLPTLYGDLPIGAEDD